MLKPLFDKIWAREARSPFVELNSPVRTGWLTLLHVSDVPADMTQALTRENKAFALEQFCERYHRTAFRSSLAE